MARIPIHAYYGYVGSPDELAPGTAILNQANATALGLPNSATVITLANTTSFGSQLFIPTPTSSHPASIWIRTKTASGWGTVTQIT